MDLQEEALNLSAKNQKEIISVFTKTSQGVLRAMNERNDILRQIFGLQKAFVAEEQLTTVDEDSVSTDIFFDRLQKKLRIDWLILCRFNDLPYLFFHIKSLKGLVNWLIE